jgi:hypothetical protein
MKVHVLSLALKFLYRKGLGSYKSLDIPPVNVLHYSIYTGTFIPALILDEVIN